MLLFMRLGMVMVNLVKNLSSSQKLGGGCLVLVPPRGGAKCWHPMGCVPAWCSNNEAKLVSSNNSMEGPGNKKTWPQHGGQLVEHCFHIDAGDSFHIYQ